MERIAVTVADGALDLVLSSVLDQPRLAAMRVINASTGAVVQAINCGGPAYTAADGTAYVTDASFAGGSVEAPGDLIYAINCGGPALVADGVSYIADDHFKNGRAYIGVPARLLVTDTPLIKDGAGQPVANTDAVRTFDYTFQTIPHSGQFGECILSYNDGLRREGRETVWSSDQQSYTEFRTTRDVNGLLLSKTADVYQVFPFGWRHVASVVDPDGVALITTWTYEEGSANPADPKPAGYGQVKRELSPGGAWTDFFYNEDGSLSRTVRQYLDAAPGDPFNSVTETVTRSTVGAKKIEARVTTVRGVETARSFILDEDLGDEFIRASITATLPGAEWNDSTNLFTLTRTADSTYPDPLKRGQTLWIRATNGVVTRHAYASATGGGRTVTSDTGVPASVITLANLSADPGAVAEGTRVLTTTNVAGETVATVTRDIATGHVLESWEALEFDAAGRPTLIGYGDGTTRETVYADTNGSCSACSGAGASPVSETDRDGVVTTYVYDPLGRRVETTRLGITEKLVYDAAGRVVERLRSGASGPAISLEKTTYDRAGRVVATEDALGNVTDYAYTYPSGGGLTTTITQPAATPGADRGTRIETTYADGRPKEISGTAVSPLRYVYDTWSAAAEAGEWTQEIKVGDANAETEWTKTYADLAGRTVKQEYPAAVGTVAATMAYNALGQLVRQTDPDGVQTLFAYNTEGTREYTVLDWDRDGVIDFEGTDSNGDGVIDIPARDRITRATADVYSRSGAVVRRTTTRVWHADNLDTSTVVSVAERDGYGNRSWQTDSAGAVSSTTVTRGAPGAWTVTTTAPDGSQQVQTYSAGRLASSTRKSSTGAQVTKTDYAYDAHGRVSSQTDARTGAVSFTYSSRDEVVTTTVNNGADTTTHTYDALGNVLTVTRPDSSLTTNEYHLRNNQLKKTSGSQTYPVEYTYDLHGRMKTMTTWQNAATAADAAVTTWKYDTRRGWRVEKLYADNTGTAYTYTAAGRLATRTWARNSSLPAPGSPLKTTYGYNAAGDLASTDYSDDTPDVSIAYKRFGAQASVTDGTGTRMFTYTAALGPDQEKLTAFYGDRIITRSYQGTGTGEVSGRSDGFELGVTGDLAKDYSVIHGYDSAGRLSTVTATHGSGSGAVTYAYTYGYVANSQLRASISSPLHTVVYAYEPHRDVVASLENKVGATTVSKFDYTVNSLGQRTQRANSGTAFAAASTDAFGYNAKGEVTSTTNSALPARDQSFVYDDIGNRRSFTSTAGTTSYKANSLNQYGEVASPFVPSVANPSYDLDGNQTATGLGQACVWDAENRLIAVQPVTPTAGDKKVLNSYDSQSRRVRREVFTYVGGTWSLTSDEKFIYDGWNVVAVLDASNSNAVLRSFTWGTDLSGSLQGAGGIGGLLAVKDGSNIYYYTYDANGNVSEVLNDSGAVAAHYEYTSFGDTHVTTGGYAAANEYRFSTKPLDVVSGLYYYGHRYYNPSTGRWPNRDPMDERGGNNLYRMVDNNPIVKFDVLGLAPEVRMEEDASTHFTAEGYDSSGALINTWYGAVKNYVGTALMPNSNNYGRITGLGTSTYAKSADLTESVNVAWPSGAEPDVEQLQPSGEVRIIISVRNASCGVVTLSWSGTSASGTAAINYAAFSGTTSGSYFAGFRQGVARGGAVYSLKGHTSSGPFKYTISSTSSWTEIGRVELGHQSNRVIRGETLSAAATLRVRATAL